MHKKLIFRQIALLFLGFSYKPILAQCVLKTSTQYNANNKITAQITNTYDAKNNLIERLQNGSDLYQSHAFFEYDAQNKLQNTTYKNGEKTIKSSKAQPNKDEKTNQFGEKTLDEFTQNGNISIKTSKDTQGNISQVETSTTENGKITNKETRNTQNQIVSRETFTYNSANNLIKSSIYDALLDQTKNTNNTYNTNNQLVKTEVFKNNRLESTVLYTYLKNKLIRKDTQNETGQIVFYQTIAYTKNSSIESNFYGGFMHSKIITTFDDKNNPIEISVYNENQKLIQKTINSYTCK